MSVSVSLFVSVSVFVSVSISVSVSLSLTVSLSLNLVCIPHQHTSNFKGTEKPHGMSMTAGGDGRGERNVDS